MRELKKRTRLKPALLHAVVSRETNSGRRRRNPCPFTDTLLTFAEEKGATHHALNKAVELKGNQRATFAVSFSSDGVCMASTHGDHSIRITDLGHGVCIRTLTGHPRTPWSLQFHPVQKDILASGCLGGEVRVWDLHGGSESWRMEPSSVISSVSFHPTVRLLVIATSNSLYFWDWSMAAPYARCSTANPQEHVRWVKFSPDGNQLYTGIANKNNNACPERASMWQHRDSAVSSISSSRTVLERLRVELDEQLHRLHDSLNRLFDGNGRPTTAAQGSSSLSAPGSDEVEAPSDPSANTDAFQNDNDAAPTSLSSLTGRPRARDSSDVRGISEETMPLLSGGDEDNLDRARSFAASLASSAAITGPDGLPSRDQDENDAMTVAEVLDAAAATAAADAAASEDARSSSTSLASSVSSSNESLSSVIPIISGFGESLSPDRPGASSTVAVSTGSAVVSSASGGSSNAATTTSPSFSSSLTQHERVIRQFQALMQVTSARLNHANEEIASAARMNDIIREARRDAGAGVSGIPDDRFRLPTTRSTRNIEMPGLTADDRALPSVPRIDVVGDSSSSTGNSNEATRTDRPFRRVFFRGPGSENQEADVSNQQLALRPYLSSPSRDRRTPDGLSSITSNINELSVSRATATTTSSSSSSSDLLSFYESLITSRNPLNSAAADSSTIPAMMVTSPSSSDATSVSASAVTTAVFSAAASVASSAATYSTPSTATATMAQETGPSTPRVTTPTSSNTTPTSSQNSAPNTTPISSQNSASNTTPISSQNLTSSNPPFTSAFSFPPASVAASRTFSASTPLSDDSLENNDLESDWLERTRASIDRDIQSAAMSLATRNWDDSASTPASVSVSSASSAASTTTTSSSPTRTDLLRNRIHEFQRRRRARWERIGRSRANRDMTLLRNRNLESDADSAAAPPTSDTTASSAAAGDSEWRSSADIAQAVAGISGGAAASNTNATTTSTTRPSTENDSPSASSASLSFDSALEDESRPIEERVQRMRQIIRQNEQNLELVRENSLLEEQRDRIREGVERLQRLHARHDARMRQEEARLMSLRAENQRRIEVGEQVLADLARPIIGGESAIDNALALRRARETRGESWWMSSIQQLNSTSPIFSTSSAGVTTTTISTAAGGVADANDSSVATAGDVASNSTIFQISPTTATSSSSGLPDVVPVVALTPTATVSSPQTVSTSLSALTVSNAITSSISSASEASRGAAVTTTAMAGASVCAATVPSTTLATSATSVDSSDSMRSSVSASADRASEGHWRDIGREIDSRKRKLDEEASSFNEERNGTVLETRVVSASTSTSLSAYGLAFASESGSASASASGSVCASAPAFGSASASAPASGSASASGPVFTSVSGSASSPASKSASASRSSFKSRSSKADEESKRSSSAQSDASMTNSKAGEKRPCTDNQNDFYSDSSTKRQKTSRSSSIDESVGQQTTIRRPADDSVRLELITSGDSVAATIPCAVDDSVRLLITASGESVGQQLTTGEGVNRHARLTAAASNFSTENLVTLVTDTAVESERMTLSLDEQTSRPEASAVSPNIDSPNIDSPSVFNSTPMTVGDVINSTLAESDAASAPVSTSSFAPLITSNASTATPGNSGNAANSASSAAAPPTVGNAIPIVRLVPCDDSNSSNRRAVLFQPRFTWEQRAEINRNSQLAADQHSHYIDSVERRRVTSARTRAEVEIMHANSNEEILRLRSASTSTLPALRASLRDADTLMRQQELVREIAEMGEQIEEQVSTVTAGMAAQQRRRRESRWDMMEEAPLLGSTAAELIPAATTSSTAAPAASGRTASDAPLSEAPSSGTWPGRTRLGLGPETAPAPRVRSRFLRRATQHHLASQMENQRNHRQWTADSLDPRSPPSNLSGDAVSLVEEDGSTLTVTRPAAALDSSEQGSRNSSTSAEQRPLRFIHPIGSATTETRTPTPPVARFDHHGSAHSLSRGSSAAAESSRGWRYWSSTRFGSPWPSSGRRGAAAASSEGALVRRDVGASASTVTEGDDVVIVDVNEPVVGDTIDRFRPRRSAHLQMEYDRHIREVRQIAERNRLQALPGAEDSSIPGQRRGSSLPRITLTPDLEEDVEAPEGFGSATGNFVGNRNYHPPLLDRPRSSTPDTDSNHDDDQSLRRNSESESGSREDASGPPPPPPPPPWRWSRYGSSRGREPTGSGGSSLAGLSAGVYMGTGELGGVFDCSYRVQWWDFRRLQPPLDLSSFDPWGDDEDAAYDRREDVSNIIVSRCKFHNDGSIKISHSGHRLATFITVASRQTGAEQPALAVFSLLPENRGQCLVRKPLGMKAVGVAFSPFDNYVFVGLSAQRLIVHPTSSQSMGEIYQLHRVTPLDEGENVDNNANTLTVTRNAEILHPAPLRDQENVPGVGATRAWISPNVVAFLPSPGAGFVYGTNRGNLQICRTIATTTRERNWYEKEAADSRRRGAPLVGRHLFAPRDLASERGDHHHQHHVGLSMGRRTSAIESYRRLTRRNARDDDDGDVDLPRVSRHRPRTSLIDPWSAEILEASDNSSDSDDPLESENPDILERRGEGYFNEDQRDRVRRNLDAERFTRGSSRGSSRGRGAAAAARGLSSTVNTLDLSSDQPSTSSGSGGGGEVINIGVSSAANTLDLSSDQPSTSTGRRGAVREGLASRRLSALTMDFLEQSSTSRDPRLPTTSSSVSTTSSSLLNSLRDAARRVGSPELLRGNSDLVPIRTTTTTVTSASNGAEEQQQQQREPTPTAVVMRRVEQVQNLISRTGTSGTQRTGTENADRGANQYGDPVPIRSRSPPPLDSQRTERPTPNQRRALPSQDVRSQLLLDIRRHNLRLQRFLNSQLSARQSSDTGSRVQRIANPRLESPSTLPPASSLNLSNVPTTSTMVPFIPDADNMASLADNVTVAPDATSEDSSSSITTAVDPSSAAFTVFSRSPNPTGDFEMEILSTDEQSTAPVASGVDVQSMAPVESRIDEQSMAPVASGIDERSTAPVASRIEGPSSNSLEASVDTP